jgi:amidase
MSKTKTPSQPPGPAKWQLVLWQKKDEQYARIPHEWRLSSLPSPHVTNYTDIPRKCGLLSEAELKITEEYDATALAEAIRSRKLKCVDVTRAFCKVPTHLP